MTDPSATPEGEPSEAAAKGANAAANNAVANMATAANERDGTSLPLGGSLGGHRPTALGAVAQMMRAATRVELQRNRISAAEATLMTPALSCTSTLTALDLSFNDLGDEGVAEVSGALVWNSHW